MSAYKEARGSQAWLHTRITDELSKVLISRLPSMPDR